MDPKVPGLPDHTPDRRVRVDNCVKKNELLLLEISYFTWDSTSFRDSAVLYQINIAEIKNQVHQFFWL